jgi:hypothetical protein
MFLRRICPCVAITYDVDKVQELLDICYFYGDNGFTLLDGFDPCWIMAYYL